MLVASYVFGALGVLCTIVIYQQKKRGALLLSKLVSDLIWFLHYVFLGAYSGTAIAIIGALRELIFMNREKKWAKHPAWLVLFLGLSVLCGVLTWKNLFSIFPCIASAISVISFWIGKPKLSRFLSYPISACMLTYDIACVSVAGIINEIVSISSAIVGNLRLDKKSIPEASAK